MGWWGYLNFLTFQAIPQVPHSKFLTKSLLWYLLSKNQKIFETQTIKQPNIRVRAGWWVITYVGHRLLTLGLWPWIALRTLILIIYDLRTLLYFSIKQGLYVIGSYIKCEMGWWVRRSWNKQKQASSVRFIWYKFPN